MGSGGHTPLLGWVLVLTNESSTTHPHLYRPEGFWNLLSGFMIQIPQMPVRGGMEAVLGPKTPCPICLCGDELAALEAAAHPPSLQLLFRRATGCGLLI